MQANLESICDGCGARVTPEHVRERIQRLEWATRFRPLHIQTLLLAAAPPAALEEFFYAVPVDSPAQLLHAVLLASGIEPDGRESEECLAELQRHGSFLAYLRECPGFVPQDVNQRLSLRVRFSYRPKFLVPLDSVAQTAVEELKPGELGVTRVIAFSGDDLPQMPSQNDWTRFTESLRQRLQACRA